MAALTGAGPRHSPQPVIPSSVATSTRQAQRSVKVENALLKRSSGGRRWRSTCAHARRKRALPRRPGGWGCRARSWPELGTQRRAAPGSIGAASGPRLPPGGAGSGRRPRAAWRRGWTARSGGMAKAFEAARWRVMLRPMPRPIRPALGGAMKGAARVLVPPVAVGLGPARNPTADGAGPGPCARPRGRPPPGRRRHDRAGLDGGRAARLPQANRPESSRRGGHGPTRPQGPLGGFARRAAAGARDTGRPTMRIKTGLALSAAAILLAGTATAQDHTFRFQSSDPSGNPQLRAPAGLGRDGGGALRRPQSSRGAAARGVHRCPQRDAGRHRRRHPRRPHHRYLLLRRQGPGLWADRQPRGRLVLAGRDVRLHGGRGRARAHERARGALRPALHRRHHAGARGLRVRRAARGRGRPPGASRCARPRGSCSRSSRRPARRP